jgi:hypothetical protein
MANIYKFNTEEVLLELLYFSLMVISKFETCN